MAMFPAEVPRMNVVDTSALDKVLAKDVQSTVLNSVLEVENIVQCCEAQHGRLMSYLSASDRIETLLTYAFGRHVVGDLEEDDGLDESSLSKDDLKKAKKEAKRRKKQAEKERKQFMKSIKKRKDKRGSSSVNEEDYADLVHAKYSDVAVRVLTCGVGALYTAFGLPDEGDRLFSIVFAVPCYLGELSGACVRHFLKICQSLLNHKRAETLSFVGQRPHILASLLAHIGASSMADVCVHFLQALDASILISWLQDTQFLYLLMDRFLPKKRIVVSLYVPDPAEAPEAGSQSPKTPAKEHKRVQSASWRARLKTPPPNGACAGSPPLSSPIRLVRASSVSSLDSSMEGASFNFHEEEDGRSFPEGTPLSVIVADFGGVDGKGGLIDITPGRRRTAIYPSTAAALPSGQYQLVLDDESLLGMFPPTTDGTIAAIQSSISDTQESSARVLVGMIDTLCHHQADPGVQFLPVLPRLLEGVLSSPENPGKSVPFIHGVAIVTRLVRHYKWTVTRPLLSLKDAAGAWIGETPTVEAQAVVATGVSAQAMTDVISTIYHKLPLFQKLLDKGPAEPLPTSWGSNLAPPLGHARLKVVILFSMLVQMRAAVLDAELIRIGSVNSMCELFFGYPWNNFLHYYVSSTLLALLCSPNGQIVQDVLAGTSVHEKLLGAVARNKEVIADPKARTGALGYMGHVVVMANSIANSLSTHPLLAEHEPWQTYVREELAEINEAQARKICGDAVSQTVATPVETPAEAEDTAEPSPADPSDPSAPVDYAQMDLKSLNAEFSRAVSAGDTAGVVAALDSGANVDTPDTNNEFPLMVAVKLRNFAMAAILLERGGNVNAVNSAGYTALHKVVGTPRLLLKTDEQRSAHADIVRMLLEKGASVNKTNLKDQHPLASAARYGHIEAVRMMLGSPLILDFAEPSSASLPEVNKKDTFGTTPLYSAIQSNHGDISAMLLHRGGAVAAKLPSVLRDQLRDEEGQNRLKVDKMPFFGIGSYLEIASEPLSASMLAPEAGSSSSTPWYIFTPEDLKHAVTVGKPGYEPIMGGTLCFYRKAVMVAMEADQLERAASTPEDRAALEARLTVAKATLDEAIAEHSAAAMVARILTGAARSADHNAGDVEGEEEAVVSSPTALQQSPPVAPITLSDTATAALVQYGADPADLDDPMGLLQRLASSLAMEKYKVNRVPNHLVQLYRSYAAAAETAWEATASRRESGYLPDDASIDTMDIPS